MNDGNNVINTGLCIIICVLLFACVLTNVNVLTVDRYEHTNMTNVIKNIEQEFVRKGFAYYDEFHNFRLFDFKKLNDLK